MPSLLVIAIAAGTMAASLASPLAAMPHPLPLQQVSTIAVDGAEDPKEIGRREQRKFESIRRMNLPDHRGDTPSRGTCQEPVGLMCYTYDETSPAPAPERDLVTRARTAMLKVMDSLGTAHPREPWIANQRIRYHLEVGHKDIVTKIADDCTGMGWWCLALRGFARHVTGRYVEAGAAYDSALVEMNPRDQCRWKDLTPYLDDDTRRVYIRTKCGEADRDAFEARTWWFARTRFGLAGNDSRTEHFARLTYIEFMRDAPSAFRSEFNDADHE